MFAASLVVGLLALAGGAPTDVTADWMRAWYADDQIMIACALIAVDSQRVAARAGGHASLLSLDRPVRAVHGTIA